MISRWKIVLVIVLSSLLAVSPVAAKPDPEYVGTFLKSEGKVIIFMEQGKIFLHLGEMHVSDVLGIDLYLAKPGSGAADWISIGVFSAGTSDMNFEIPSDVNLTRYSKVILYNRTSNQVIGEAILEKFN